MHDLFYLRVELDCIIALKLGQILHATDPIHQSVDLTLQLSDAINHIVLLEVVMHLDQVIHLNSFVDLVVNFVIIAIESLWAVL